MVTMPTMSKSWFAVLLPLLMYLISQGFVLYTGVELSEGQQTALEGILNTLYVTASAGSAVGIAKVLKGASTSSQKPS